MAKAFQTNGIRRLVDKQRKLCSCKNYDSLSVVILTVCQVVYADVVAVLAEVLDLPTPTLMKFASKAPELGLQIN